MLGGIPFFMDDSVSNLGDAENSASIDFSLLSSANATLSPK